MLYAIRYAIIFVMLLSGQALAIECNKDGPYIERADLCGSFKTFLSSSTTHDPRLIQRISADSNEPIRSIALIISSSEYPHLPKNMMKLPAAKKDADNLVSFFRDNQKFDEVILLENKDATVANIDYFLKDYLPQQGVEYNKRTRLIIAYTGHGLSDNPTRSAAFLLSNASSVEDTSNQYSMDDLRLRLHKLGESYFHVLALINACFGGNVFGSENAGGNPSISDLPGAHGLTAGSKEKVAVSIGEGRGSIFFDSIINGVSSGDADLDYLRLVDKDGGQIQQGGITRLGALASYLVTEFDIINKKKIPYEGGILQIDRPWIGSVRGDSVSRGGFFFLSPIKLAPGQVTAFTRLKGPLSSVPGRPDIKVFGAQEEYPIRGIDVTMHEGDIDWKQVAREGNLRFAYARVSSWAGLDKSFTKHWGEIKSSGLDRGALHVFDFCKPVDDQLKDIREALPNGEEALPFTIELRLPSQDSNLQQYACYRQDDIDRNREKIIELARKIRSFYRKTPIISGNRNTLAVFIDKKFEEFMIWLAIYRGGSNGGDISLPGSNPWTIWQYTAHLSVKGIGDNVNGNVFFGNEAQYEAFKKGNGNTALVESLGPSISTKPQRSNLE